MAFAELVTLLRLDASQYERELKRVQQETARTLAQQVVQVHQLHPSVLGIGSTTGRGSTIGGSAEAIERRMRQINDQADREYRRLLATQAAAEKENENRRLVAIKTEQKAARQAHDERMSDIKQQILLKRELERQDQADEKKLNEMYRQDNAARIADMKQQGILQREIDKQNLQDNASKLADIKQQILLKRELEKQDAAEAKQIAANEQAERRLVALQQQAVKRAEATQLKQDVGLQRAGLPTGAGQFIGIPPRDTLDEARQKFYQIHEEIAKSGTLSQRLNERWQEMGRNSLTGVTDSFKQIASVVGLTAGAGIVGGFAALVKHGFDLNREWEKNRISIAAVLQLTTNLKDAQGKILSPTKQMSLNIGEAEKLMNMLRDAAVKTVLTTEQAVNNFKTALGFATSAGITPEQAVPLITNIGNLATSLGARGERQQQFEARSLLTGQFIQRSRLGQVLGITKADIDNARQAGTLLQFLNEKLAAGQKFADQFAHSFQGALTTLTSKANEFVRLAMEDTVKRITGRVVELNQVVTEDKIRGWAETLSNALAHAYDAIEKFAHSEGLKQLQAVFQFLVDHAKELTELFIAFKAAQVAGGLMSLGSSLRAPGSLLGGTALGGAAAAVPQAAGLAITGALLGRGASFLVNELPESLGGAAGNRQAAAAESALADMNARRTAAQLRLQAAMHEVQIRQARVAGAETLMARASFGPGGGPLTPPDADRNLRVQQYFLAQAVAAQKKAEEELSREHVLNELKKIGVSENMIQRVAKLRSQDSEKAKQAAAAERLFIAREYAKLADDKIQKIRDEAEAEVLNIQKHVKEEAKRAELVRAIWEHAHTEAQKIRDQDAKDQKDKLDDLSTQQRDIVSEELDALHSAYRSRQEIIKEAYNLEKNTARELIQLQREHAHAIREVTRAEEDRSIAEQRFGVAGTEVHAQILRRRIDSLFRREMPISRSVDVGTGVATNLGRPGASVEQQLINVFSRQEGQVGFNQETGGVVPVQGQGRGQSVDAIRRGTARAQLFLRNLREGIVGGSVTTQQALQQLGRMGVNVSGPEGKNIVDALRMARTDILEGQVTEGGIADQEREQGVTRGLQDARSRVQTAQQQVVDVDQRLSELKQNYTQTLADLKEKSSQALKTFTDALIKTGQDSRKFLDALIQDNFRVSAPEARLFRGLSRITPQSAGRAATAQFTPAQQIVFQAGSINIAGVKDLDMNKVAEQLQGAMRAAAPARR